MNSFQAKIGWKRLGNREIKTILPFHSYPTRCRKLQKKKANKFKNTILVSFEAKIG